MLLRLSRHLGFRQRLANLASRPLFGPCLRFLTTADTGNAVAAPPPESSSLDSAGDSSNNRVSAKQDLPHHVDPTTGEELLGWPEEFCVGFPDLQFDQILHSRYRVIRKLGFGSNSSVWLGMDQREFRYVALKVLTGYATRMCRKGLLLELPTMQHLSEKPSPEGKFCVQLLDHFEYTGLPHEGDHLCLVTEVMGGDVSTLRRLHRTASGDPFPLPLAKRILHHLLRGVSFIHSRGVIHTDLKPCNVLFTTNASTDAGLDGVLADDPPRRHPPHLAFEGKIEAAVSQPLPVPTLSECMDRTYVLCDFGSAQPSTERTTNMITPIDLRPPEVILGAAWNGKVDIWTFGCLVFELTIGRGLFNHAPNDEYNLDADEAHLWQMMGYTGLTFEPEQLKQSADAAKYFTRFCYLQKKPPRLILPIDDILRQYKVLDDCDLVSVDRVMRKCLQLNPDERPTAAELLQDPWWSA